MILVKKQEKIQKNACESKKTCLYWLHRGRKYEKSPVHRQ